MNSGVNLANSRRVRAFKCIYYKRDKTIRDLSEYETKKKPNGVFYAKQENAKYSQNNVVGGAFMFDSMSATISTTDVVNIEENDVVKYKGNMWRVVSVQTKDIVKRNQVCSNTRDCITYLELKR